MSYRKNPTLRCLVLLPTQKTPDSAHLGRQRGNLGFYLWLGHFCRRAASDNLVWREHRSFRVVSTAIGSVTVAVSDGSARRRRGLIGQEPRGKINGKVAAADFVKQRRVGHFAEKGVNVVGRAAGRQRSRRNNLLESRSFASICRRSFAL